MEGLGRRGKAERRFENSILLYKVVSSLGLGPRALALNGRISNPGAICRGEQDESGSERIIWCARQDLNLQPTGSKAYSVVVCKPLILRLVNRIYV